MVPDGNRAYVLACTLILWESHYMIQDWMRLGGLDLQDMSALTFSHQSPGMILCCSSKFLVSRPPFYSDHFPGLL
jgi:hypothetical protein